MAPKKIIVLNFAKFNVTIGITYLLDPALMTKSDSGPQLSQSQVAGMGYPKALFPRQFFVDRLLLRYRRNANYSY